MAIMTDNVIDDTMGMENCLKMDPVEPDIKAMGTNTAEMTTATPMSAPVI